MPEVDVVLRPAARRFLEDVATATERAEIKFRIDSIALDPFVDDRTKFRMRTTPDLVMYHDGMYWIIYVILNRWTLSIIGIGTAGDP